METERGLVTVDALRNVFTIARPEPKADKIGPFRGWKVSETVNPSVLANPITGLHVVIMRLPLESRGLRLLCRKEAMLVAGNGKEVGRRFSVVPHGLHDSTNYLCNHA